MNRTLLIIVAFVVVALAVVGVAVVGTSRKSTPVVTPAPTARPTESNIISSIKDALTRGSSLECNFATASGTKTHAYIKNGMIRSDTTGKTAQESGSVIIKDKKIYFWNAASAMMMEISDISVTPVKGKSAASLSEQQKNVMDSLEQYKKDCNVATVADSVFDLPKGVKFQDFSSMTKSLIPTAATSVAPSISQ